MTKLYCFSVLTYLTSEALNQVTARSSAVLDLVFVIKVRIQG